MPDDYLDAQNLVGPVERIKERWRKYWEPMPYTGVTIRTEQDEAYDLMAELADTIAGIPDYKITRVNNLLPWD